MGRFLKVMFVTLVSLLLGSGCVPDRDKMEVGVSLVYRFGDSKNKNTYIPKARDKKYSEEQIANYKKYLLRKQKTNEELK